MKVLSIALIFLSLSISAFAGTDFKCVNDCTRRGYMYQLCVQNCSYDSMPFPNPPQQKMLNLGDVTPSAQDRIYIDQQIRNAQQQQEEYKKRQRILDLQLEEAEAKAAERRQKRSKEPEPEKDDE